MKTSALAASALCLMAAPALAAVTMGDLDMSGDKFVTYQEMRDAMPRIHLSEFRDIDTNSDQRISSEELQSPEAQKIIAQLTIIPSGDRPVRLLDQDGDGSIMMDDFTRVYPTFSEASFREIDTNDDNRVSYSEYYTPETYAAIARCTAPAFMDLASADTNGDNFLSWEEAAAALPGLTQSEFRAIDVNSDNRVSNVEFLMPHSRCVVDRHQS